MIRSSTLRHMHHDTLERLSMLVEGSMFVIVWDRKDGFLLGRGNNITLNFIFAGGPSVPFILCIKLSWTQGTQASYKWHA